MKYRKKKLKKYELGVQQMTVPPVETPAESFASVHKDTAQGMQMGSAFGPWGAILGGAIGTGKGLISTGTRRRQQRMSNQEATAYNKYFEKQGSVVDDPNLQFYQAKKGIDMTKYKKGTLAVDTGDEDNKITEGKVMSGSMENGQIINKEISYKIAKKKPVSSSIAPPHYKPLIYGKNSGQLSKYNKGTKLIEAEDKELIFAKQGNQYKLKADLKGPTHEEGGIVVNATEGDVIFPGKKRAEILSAYKKGDYKKIDKERAKLPKDSAKAARGTYLPPGGSKINWQDESFNSLPGDTIEDSSVEPKTSNNFNWMQFAQTAPTVYNSIKGSFDKPVKTTRRFYEPKKLEYVDTTAPLLRQSNANYETQKRNISGMQGNRGQQLNALGQAAANRFNTDSNIIASGVERKAGINNANVELTNQAKLTNLNLANQYDDLDLQNKGKQTEYTGKALEGISANAYNRELTNNLKNRDKLLMNTLSTNDYEYLPNGKIRLIPKAKKGKDMTKKKGC